MEKQDILIVAIAVVAFAVLALVVLPLVTGQSAPMGTGTRVTVTPTPRATPVPMVTSPRPTVTATIPAPTPTGTQPWDGSVKNVGFIGQPESQATLAPNLPIPQEPNRTRELVTYAEISGRWSGTTENLYIPTPYWVLEYTAEPLALPPDAYPVFILQVFDAHNPNRVVITPIRQPIYEEPTGDPWTRKVFEGNRRYYFKIDTSFIKSYTITIKVPQEYL